MGFDFVAIDFETANHERSSACAVGLTVVRDGEVVDSTAYLIRPPSRDFHWACVDTHGLTWDDVKREPNFADRWRGLREILQDEVLVAHQAHFDRDVLRGCLDYYGIRYRLNPFACTLALARDAFPFRRFGLAHLCCRLKIPLPEHHEPGCDAKAAARVALRGADRVGVRSAVQLARRYGV